MASHELSAERRRPVRPKGRRKGDQRPSRRRSTTARIDEASHHAGSDRGIWWHRGRHHGTAGGEHRCGVRSAAPMMRSTCPRSSERRRTDAPRPPAARRRTPGRVLLLRQRAAALTSLARSVCSHAELRLWRSSQRRTRCRPIWSPEASRRSVTSCSAEPTRRLATVLRPSRCLLIVGTDHSLGAADG